MTSFVLDNSITMRWLMETDKATDQKYAEDILKSLLDNDALVPNLWHLEVVNVLVNSEKRKEIDAGVIERFISQLDNLPIHVDPLTSHQSFTRTMALSRIYNLSSYDAAYLELAIREGLPIATLDKDLRKAAKKADVNIYKK